MFITNWRLEERIKKCEDAILDFKIEIDTTKTSISEAKRGIDLEMSKIVEHIRNIRGSINRHGVTRDQTQQKAEGSNVEEPTEEKETKDIKGMRYY